MCASVLVLVGMRPRPPSPPRDVGLGSLGAATGLFGVPSIAVVRLGLRLVGYVLYQLLETLFSVCSISLVSGIISVVVGLHLRSDQKGRGQNVRHTDTGRHFHNSDIDLLELTGGRYPGKMSSTCLFFVISQWPSMTHLCIYSPGLMTSSHDSQALSR